MTDPEIEALAMVFTHALRAAGCDAIDALAVLDLAVRHGQARCRSEFILRANERAERIFNAHPAPRTKKVEQ